MFTRQISDFITFFNSVTIYKKSCKAYQVFTKHGPKSFHKLPLIILTNCNFIVQRFSNWRVAALFRFIKGRQSLLGSSYYLRFVVVYNIQRHNLKNIFERVAIPKSLRTPGIVIEFSSCHFNRLKIENRFQFLSFFLPAELIGPIARSCSCYENVRPPESSRFKNFVDPAKLKLPTDEELGDTPIYC